MRAARREVCELPYLSLRCKPGCLTNSEGSSKLTGGEFQYRVSVSLRHGQNQIGVRSDFGSELASCKGRRIGSKRVKDGRCITMNGMADHGASASTGCCEADDLVFCGVRSGEALGGG
ncbi:MAG: hypothetical protein JWR34_4746 [Mycobacterium sp.]|nr:hypothetical protein [Mycobacterium sp.]